MTEISKLIPIRVLAVLAFAAAACSVEAGNQIPCVEDFSCPNDYPVCVSGKCTAGTSSAKASVAVVGAEGHATTDFLSGTVRVIVSARASSGVETVSLAFGTSSFSASTPAATPPLYAFDVDTATLADGDRDLTATLTAGDGTVASATGTLHVDNAKPVITSFTVANGTSTTITAGNSVAISASFTGGTTAIITDGTGSVGIASGGSLLVSPDTLTTYSLVVTSRSGVSVQSGTTGQPPNVSVAVAQRASTTGGNFSVNRTLIDHNDNGTLSFTAPTFSGAFTALVKDPGGQSVGAIASNGTLSNVPVASMTASTTQLTYTLVISNGATIPDTLSIPVIVTVRPHISAFTFGLSGPTTTTVDPGDTVSLNYNFSGGASANINGVSAPLPGPLPFSNLQASTVYTLTVTNSAGISSTQTATATVRAKIYSFTVGATQAASSNQAIITSGSTTNLFASFAGSVAPNADLACATACSGTLPTPAKIVNGGSAVVTPSATGTFNYTLTVTPSAGAPPLISSPVTVKVVPMATAANLIADSTLIHHGTSVPLTPDFSFNGTVPGTATVEGSDGSRYTNLTSLTDIHVAPASTTVYTLKVVNAAGTPATNQPQVTVTVVQGSWSSLNSVTPEARQGATVTALSNGKVLVAGGLDATNAPRDTARICDATGACTMNTMRSPRAFHTAVTIGGSGPNAGKVLLAGGYNAVSPPLVATFSAEFYDPQTDTFAVAADVKTTGSGAVSDPRARHIAVVLADSTTVLFAGGRPSDAFTDGSTDLDNAIRYDASTDPATTSNVSNTMAQRRANFTGTLVGTKVLVVGGRAGNATSELFDPAVGSGTFSATPTLGALPSGEDKRSHTAVFITGANPEAGKVLISGGLTGSSTRSTTQFLFNPTDSTFAAAPALVGGRSNHAAVGLADHVLICGGTDGTNTLATCELYDPSAASQLVTASMLEARRDFGLARMTISSVDVFFGAGGTAVGPIVFAETYEPN